MENTNQSNEPRAIVNLILVPAFFTYDGTIVAANAAALSRGVEEGTKVEALMRTGQEEYNSLGNAMLMLSLDLSGQICEASVQGIQGGKLFILQEPDRQELRAYALASLNLRMPLNSMMNAASRLSKICTDEETLRQVDELHHSMFQVLRIVGNMSDAYRYAEPNSDRPEMIDMSGLIIEMLEGCESYLVDINHPVQLHYERTPAYGLAVSEKLERAVSNLMLNAAKYSDPGDVIQASLRQKGDRLILTVENELGKYFEQVPSDFYTRFRRAPGIEDPRHGIGLGMSLISAAASAHEGTVLAEEKDGVLRVTLTVRVRPAAPGDVHSTRVHFDYAGEWNHQLVEFSELLPARIYRVARH